MGAVALPVRWLSSSTVFSMRSTSIFPRSIHKFPACLPSYVKRRNSSFNGQFSSLPNDAVSSKATDERGGSGTGTTIFDKIISGEIPSTTVYEDEAVLAFRDINPQAPVHVLVIPKIRNGLTQLSEAEPKHHEILGHLLYASKKVAEKEGITDYRVVINNGPSACQSVYHLHLHILGGRQMKWPPG